MGLPEFSIDEGETTMSHVEKILFLLGTLNISSSMLAAWIGMTEKSLTSDDPGPITKKRLTKLVDYVHMAQKVCIKNENILCAIDEPINMNVIEDKDCSTCANHYIRTDEATDSEVRLAFEASIEMFLLGLQIDELNDEIKALKRSHEK